MRGFFEKNIFNAVIYGGIYEVNRLLQEGIVDINVQNELGNTCLHQAVNNGQFLIAKVLIDNGVDVNKKNNLGATALHLACAWGHSDIIKLLIDKGADINSADIDGWTALHYICKYGDPYPQKIFMDNLLKNTEYEKGIQLLVDNGADIDAKDNAGETPLDIAREYNNIRMSTFLNELKYLRKISTEGDYVAVKTLINISNNVYNKLVKKKYALKYATLANQNELSEVLLDDIFCIRDSYGDTLLHWAAGNGQKDILKSLTSIYRHVPINIDESNLCDVETLRISYMGCTNNNGLTASEIAKNRKQKESEKILRTRTNEFLTDFAIKLRTNKKLGYGKSF